MKNNLKICLIIYIIMNNEKSNDYNLEKGLDFGDTKLNILFINLDEETKKKITKYPKKDIQIEILKNLEDPEFTELWNNLPEKQKNQLDTLGLRDRFIFLKDLSKKKKAKAENNYSIQPKIEEVQLEEYPSSEEDEKNEFKISKELKSITPQTRFNNLVKIFYNNVAGELEVKFGTKGIKSITKNNYDNVVKKLKSSGFSVIGEETGNYYLRINCEFLDSTTGRFKMSNIRTEIKSLPNIQEYCRTNDIKNLPQELFVEHITKGPMIINKEKILPVDFDDFNFRVTYSSENEINKMGIINNLIDNWKKSKKEFRFINRVSFQHDDFPFIVDISIVKYGNRMPDKFGRANRGQIIRVYTLEESNVLNNEEIYEIEIEVDNKKIGPGTKFNTPQLIVDSLRKGIKYVLSGMQGSNYPISYPEQRNVIESYMKLIWKDNYDPKKFISSRNFIGPNSITLQMINIAPINENSNEPNIRKDFIVTEKADGERHLLYISQEGKIYLINTNMDVIFTGAKTNNEECINTIIDGELIVHDKNGKYINLYAAFDIYYIKKVDVRGYTFMLQDNEKDIYKSRYQLLKFVNQNLKPVSIENNREESKKIEQNIFKNLLSPLRFSVKEFFPTSTKQTIFEGCKLILQKESEGRFEYNTDGLIFTHAFYGVGSNKIGKVESNERITWEYSFKWKPPQFNTVDFLVTTEKGPNGDDVIKSLFEEGQNNETYVQYNEYKKIILRCGFNEKRDGFINPCQDIIDDNLPEYKINYEDKYENSYVPQRFYPTDPYDPNAGLCNIMLRMDNSGAKKMFSEENQVIEDNTIVEFRYDLNKEDGWKWIPLRVRYDKTARLRKGEKEYGNSYNVCNSNWRSIHPSGRITSDMLSSGQNIPDINVSEDKYYNTPTGKFKTEAMKQFHNLYVKKNLIVGVSKQGDTLIDFACGKAGDLPKWISAKLSFVFGIDISKDNLENRLDGACARYLKSKKTNKNMPYALFVNGNSAYNIKDGSAMLSEKAKQITNAVFGNGPKEAEKIGKGVSRQYGKGADGFNISSCQFAIHYFFENPDTLKGFMKNLAECTKHNGYFIGSAYDGKLVFNELKKTKTGDSIKIIEDGKKIWEIIKSYGSETFDDDSSSIGYRIDVYQESINQVIPEYLINYDYFNRVMSAYGFELISREEAKQFGLPEGSGLFSELFLNMIDEITRNKMKANNYGKAPLMTAIEKKISFLNRYFIYKKVRVINTESIELELGEYEETASLRNKEETNHAIEIAKDVERKSKPKIRKLSKKLLLVAATEAIDESNKEPENQEKKTKKEENDKKGKKGKKIIIIESDESE